MCRLRQLPDTDPRVQAEWITIRAEAIRNREVLVRAHPSMADQSTKSELKLELASWVDMFKAGSIRQTMIGILLMFFQQFVGINAVSNLLLEESRLTDCTPACLLCSNFVRTARS